MEFNLTKKNIIFLIAFSLVCLLITVLLCIFVYKKRSNDYILKNNYNSYQGIYVTNDKQASIYLTKYYNLLNNSIGNAYELLDKDENKLDFSTIDKFKNYVNKLNISNTNILKFRIYKKRGYVYYDIYDGNNNNIIFKAKGIMNYTVIFR